MKIGQIVPKPVRNALRPPYYAWLRYRTIHHPTSIEETHRYWTILDSDNYPHEYALRSTRSEVNSWSSCCVAMCRSKAVSWS